MAHSNFKVIVIAGARPNFMKVAPFLKALGRHNLARRNGEPLLEVRLLHTGQHYDERMSEVFFRELGIAAPDVNLEVGSGTHAVQTANIMLKFEPVCQDYRADWVVVVGDVNSTIACTLVAAKLGIKVAHVEAGLRSFDRTMPEEINRVVTDSLADLLFTHSEDANQNLKREGIPEDKIRLVGNIMIDSLIENLAQARRSTVMRRLDLKPGRFVYVTLHRPANVDNETSLTSIMRELRALSARLPIVFPIHPRTRKMLAAFALDAGSTSRFHILDPIGYHDSLCLSETAKFVLTDSGGLQEETTFLQTPCLTLRSNTERPITVRLGSNRLTQVDRLSSDLDEALNGPEKKTQIPPLWDGKTGDRCVRALLDAAPDFAARSHYLRG